MLDRALNLSLRLLENTDVLEIAIGGVQEDGTIEFKGGLSGGRARSNKLGRRRKAIKVREVRFAKGFDRVRKRLWWNPLSRSERE